MVCLKNNTSDVIVILMKPNHNQWSNSQIQKDIRKTRIERE